MARFHKQNEVVVFVVLVVGLSWIPWYLGSPDILTAMPSALALIMAFALGGKEGGMSLLRSAVRWRVGWGWWAVAAFGMVGIYFAGLAAFLATGGEAPSFGALRNEFLLVPIFLVVVFLPFNGPVGEELGWRGYLLPRLQSGRMGPLGASLLIGIVWGLWHLPVFFNESSVQGSLGFEFLAPFVAGSVASAVIMTWLYNRTRASVLVAGIIWHASTDFWGPLILTDISIAAGPGGSVELEGALYAAVLVVLVLAATAIAVSTRGRLGYRPPSD